MAYAGDSDDGLLSDEEIVAKMRGLMALVTGESGSAVSSNPAAHTLSLGSIASIVIGDEDADVGTGTNVNEGGNAIGFDASPAHHSNQLAANDSTTPPPSDGVTPDPFPLSESLEDPLGSDEYDVVWREGSLGCAIKKRNGWPTIHSITPGVAVDLSVHKIQLNDVMIRINGMDTKTIGFRAVIETMRSTPKPIYMRFRRAVHEASLPPPYVPSHGLPILSSRYDMMEVEDLHESLVATEDSVARQYTVLWNEGLLGVQIKRRPSDGAKVVAKFTGDGNPELFSSIAIGDVLVQIAGLKVADMSIADVYEKLKTVQKPVELVFERAPSPAPPGQSDVRQGFSEKETRDLAVPPSSRELREREAAAQGRYCDSFAGFTEEERGLVGDERRQGEMTLQRPALYEILGGCSYQEEDQHRRENSPGSSVNTQYQDPREHTELENLRESNSGTEPHVDAKSDDEDYDYDFDDNDRACSGSEEPTQPGKGAWTREEHKRFVEAAKIYVNGPWKLVAEYVGTRTVRQTMTHAQKYRQKAARRTRGLRTRAAIMRMHQGHEVSEESMAQEQLRAMLGQSRHAYLPPELVAQVNYSPGASPVASPFMPSSPVVSPYMPSSPMTYPNHLSPIWRPFGSSDGSPVLPSSPLASPGPSAFSSDFSNDHLLDPQPNGLINENDSYLAVDAPSGIWNEPPFLANRIASDQLVLVCPISAGQFGDLWLGQVGDIHVAIKQLKTKHQTQAKAVMFATEIVRMTQLSHPKIAAFVGVEWTKQWETRAVAEFLPRGDLRSFMSSPEAAILDWANFKCEAAMDIVDALLYLHSQPCALMATLTSRNVLLDGDDGLCKLSLFAVAHSRHRHLDSAPYLPWVAPEIVLGENSPAAASAIYSFGVLLCELDTARLPFFDAFNPDGTPMSSYKIAQLVALGKLEPSLSEECPEGIASLARDCLSFDPLSRPTAARIAYRLREVLKNDL